MAEAGVELDRGLPSKWRWWASRKCCTKFPPWSACSGRLAREAAQRGAALAILVDSPGTHLGVARRLKNNGIPVGYFIGPQVWAWRRGARAGGEAAGGAHGGDFSVRRGDLPRCGSAGGFRRASAGGCGAGDDESRRNLRRGTGLMQGRPIVTMLPGSRRSEIAQHYALIMEACERLSRERADRGANSVRAGSGTGLGCRAFCAVCAARRCDDARGGRHI